MSKPTKRRRLTKASSALNIERTCKVFPKDPLSPAIHDDKRNWKGFCELESEPVRTFNIVRLLFMDESDYVSRPSLTYCSKTLVFAALKYMRSYPLNKIPLIPCRKYADHHLFHDRPDRSSRRPVYGLIFLSRWREDNPVKQEQSCPEGVWFANQV